APSADGNVTAVPKQRFADASRSGDHDRARPSLVRAEECCESIARKRHMRIAIGRVQEIAALAGDNRPRQPETDCAFTGVPIVNAGVAKCLLDCLRDIAPRLLDALAERGRAGLRVAKHFTIEAHQSSARSRATAVNANDVADLSV